MLEKEAGPVDEEAQCGGSLYETSVMAGSKIVCLLQMPIVKMGNEWLV